MEIDVNLRKKLLIKLLKDTGAFKRGHFILASGKESNVYVDCRLATLDGECLDEISRQFLLLMTDLDIRPECVGGVTSGADPIVSGVILQAWKTQQTLLKGFFVRKEVKEHGTKKQIEGHLGQEVVIFDDVATTGGSSQIAIDAVKGKKVLAVMVIVDREEGAKEKFAAQGISLYSLLTLKELMADE